MAKINNQGHTSALFVWNGMSLFWGTSFNTDPHFHNTLQLVFDIENQFLLRDVKNPWRKFKSALIGENHVHQLDSNGGIQLFIYLDKDTRYAQSLKDKYLTDQLIAGLNDFKIENLQTDYFKKLLISRDCQVIFSACGQILESLVEIKVSNQVDPRVLMAINYIEAASVKQFKVKDIAQEVCLSESRLRHLFKDQVGQPIQSFVLWRRLVKSLSPVLKGVKMTEAALSSGFYDHAHMTRTYQNILGAAPSQLPQWIAQGINIIPCSNNHLYGLQTTILTGWSKDNPKESITINHKES